MPAVFVIAKKGDKMTDSVTKAIDHWIDKNPHFTKEALISSFPWMNEALAEEEIAFWLERELISRDKDQFIRTGIQLGKSLLFLDVDGVLNYSSCKKPLADNCLQNLAEIIEKAHPIVILISSWKAGWEKEDKHFQDDDATYLDTRLREHGIIISDKASRHVSSRSCAVIDWVMRYNADHWVILDDDGGQYDHPTIKSHCVITDQHHGGLTSPLAFSAVAILKG